MLRIESRPLKATPWEYFFYVDIEGNLENENIILALEDMKTHTITLRVLEIMRKSRRIYEKYCIDWNDGLWKNNNLNSSCKKTFKTSYRY